MWRKDTDKHRKEGKNAVGSLLAIAKACLQIVGGPCSPLVLDVRRPARPARRTPPKSLRNALPFNQLQRCGVCDVKTHCLKCDAAVFIFKQCVFITEAAKRGNGNSGEWPATFWGEA